MICNPAIQSLMVSCNILHLYSWYHGLNNTIYYLSFDFAGLPSFGKFSHPFSKRVEAMIFNNVIFLMIVVRHDCHGEPCCLLTTLITSLNKFTPVPYTFVSDYAMWYVYMYPINTRVPQFRYIQVRRYSHPLYLYTISINNTTNMAMSSRCIFLVLIYCVYVGKASYYEGGISSMKFGANKYNYMVVSINDGVQETSTFVTNLQVRKHSHKLFFQVKLDSKEV